MDTIWNTIYGCFAIYVAVFSWASLLAIGARVVFGGDALTAIVCFFVGVGINVAICVLAVLQVPPMAIMYSDDGWELHWMTTGLIMTPVIILALGCLYLAFRRLVLADSSLLRNRLNRRLWR